MASEHGDPEQRVRERISALRWVAIVALILLFITDYIDFGVKLWRKDAPEYAYWGLVAVALGVEVPTIRRFFVELMRHLAGIRERKDE